MPGTQRNRMEVESTQRIGAVDRIAKDWVADAAQMGPELVRSPRSRNKPELCPIQSPIDTTPERQCGSTLGMGAVTRRVTREACERNANPT